MIINVLIVLLTLTLKIKVKGFISNISPTSSLASMGSAAILEVVSVVEECPLSLSGKSNPEELQLP